jgi:glycosyltransferase involved in cell wall biosynthesis
VSGTIGSPVGVLQMVDSLVAGGLERVAVNLANSLPRSRYHAHLCTTRRDGPLDENVSADVVRLRLRRSGRFDLLALHRLVAYIRANEIRLIHAHGTSLFLAVLAARFAPRSVVVWHDHFGRYATEERPTWLYGAAARRLAAVIAVNEDLAQWSRARLGVPEDRVYYIPNFVQSPMDVRPAEGLPGSVGGRIVCVANLRRQKDHPTLLHAMRILVGRIPEASLLLVGEPSEPEYVAEVKRMIAEQGLEHHVSCLGFRPDVAAVLRACDVGVLSSTSEGFPLALVEYGLAGLPVVATAVGQCPEILLNGEAGWLVPPASPERLAENLVNVLTSPDEARRRRERLTLHVKERYSLTAVLDQIIAVYDKILGEVDKAPDPKSHLKGLPVVRGEGRPVARTGAGTAPR